MSWKFGCFFVCFIVDTFGFVPVQQILSLNYIGLKFDWARKSPTVGPAGLIELQRSGSRDVLGRDSSLSFLIRAPSGGRV